MTTSETNRPHPTKPCSNRKDYNSGTNKNLTELPDWWHQNIKMFHDYKLQSYQSPRLSSGEPLPSVINNLEQEIGQTVQMRVINPQNQGKCEIVVGGEPIGKISYYRDPKGYSIYEIERDELEEIACRHIASSPHMEEY